MRDKESGSYINPDHIADHEEILPGHFYAAYIFDEAENRGEDIRKVLENAQQLGYPIRYWWLSDAMDIEDLPDRLIVCVHHPSNAFDSGMDLFNALTGQQVRWDDLEAAALEEYTVYGHPTIDISSFRLPNGQHLYPADQ